jgi:hypothetical protein
MEPTIGHSAILRSLMEPMSGYLAITGSILETSCLTKRMFCCIVSLMELPATDQTYE